MDYCATNPDEKIRFHTSDLVLALHSDASHLSEPGFKSKTAGHFYLTNTGTKDLEQVSQRWLHYTCKNAVLLKTALKEMGHNQLKTRITIGNASAVGLIDKYITPKRAKSYDQRFNWLKCREAQKLFNVV